MAKYPSQLQDKFNLRLPDGMKDAIAARAEKNGRSMNSEIIQILDDALSGNFHDDSALVAGMLTYMKVNKGKDGSTILTMDLDKIRDISDEQQKKDANK
ncbi:Arc family DNA-binding protein [Morganella morganii]|uniref:Arc family DNA-binding protein n=1 Tax=Morganella morganii TaxID=582 RepID=UPI001BD9C4CB|nr:Arc family DNA-binding protein [Morganella morganii]EJD6109723.1 Arc family DNA-binding protein [Morganella morganii]EKU4014338.1 Arc family DNA-binding protein [Morganella morganii]ELA7703350.1 Arc family DNA-binding protein [Morganella morganii]MBT0504651.1 Arc family DNA-binding protein [Morganella morganii subsp. morganii]MDW7787211.1 Arc family DNA-binding protein [Morganella morganii]